MQLATSPLRLHQNEESVATLLDDINAKSSNIPADDTAGVTRKRIENQSSKKTKRSQNSSQSDKPKGKKGFRGTLNDLSKNEKIIQNQAKNSTTFRTGDDKKIVSSYIDGLKEAFLTNQTMDENTMFSILKKSLGMDQTWKSSINNMSSFINEANILENGNKMEKEKSTEKLKNFFSGASFRVSSTEIAKIIAQALALVSAIALVIFQAQETAGQFLLKPPGYFKDTKDFQDRKLKFDSLMNFV